MKTKRVPETRRNRRYIPVLFLALASFACKKEAALPDRPFRVPAGELLSEPIVILPNPDAPLTAEAIVRTKENTYIDIRIEGGIPLEHAFRDSAVCEHRLPVVGLYPGALNQVVFRIADERNIRFAVDTVQQQAPPLPDYLPRVRIDKIRPELMEAGFNLCELNIGGQGSYRTVPIVFDRDGVIRWYVDLGFTGGWTAPFQPLENGNFLFGFAWGLFELDIMGREIRRWGLSGFSQHHDAFEKPDGNFLVPVSHLGDTTALDHIVEVQREKGDSLKVWDLRRILDIDRYDLLYSKKDWLHVNSVWFDERDEGLIISGRNQGIVKTSKNNELRWILAPHQGWGKSGGDDPFDTSGYLLTAVDAAGRPYPEAVQEGRQGLAEFRWPWGQHAAMLLPNGNVLTFDNGWNRQFSNNEADFIRAVEYEIDEKRMTVRQVWQYGEERGAEIYSANISDVDYLPRTGNRLIVSGNVEGDERSAKVIEVTYPEGEVVFEATVVFRNKFQTGTGWQQADMVYRGERVRLY